MKQFLSSMVDRVKQALPSLLGSAKQFLSSMLDKAANFLSDKLSSEKFPLSPKLCKILVLIFVLMLVLVIGLARCSVDEIPSGEVNAGIVSIDNLDVYKKPHADSRVLDQLPLNLEVEILESKTGKDTIWGRIDNMKLPDGTKITGGWVDLLFIDFDGDTEPEVAETEPLEPAPAPVTVTMGTITASKLNIRTGPGSNYDTNGAYHKGDRVEILETRTVEDTVWGRTALGWIGTGYLRMDGTYTGDSDSNLITDGNSTVLGYGIVMLGELNVRLGPDTIYGKAGTINRANRYAYYELKDGWARIEDGWVSTEHFYIEGTSTDDAFPAVVNTEELNVRTGPHSSYMLVGTYKQGESVEILAKIGDWGCTDKGWVFLEYVDTNYSTGSGTVSNGLNVRSEPSAESDIVGTYRTGDNVTVTEVDGNWGKTDLGWINLKYVVFN